MNVKSESELDIGGRETYSRLISKHIVILDLEITTVEPERKHIH